MTTTHDSVDPITTEIVRGALIAITDEMKTCLMRTAYNPVIYEALDFTVGLFDRSGDTISIGLGLPMFIGGLSDAVKAKLAFYGEEGIRPGDILLTNDTYLMGSHLNHLVVSLPIFYDEQLVAFASVMAHWQDVGGTLAGVTKDVYSEGIQIPICKLFKDGQQDEELINIIRANVRFEDAAMGDLRAEVAAVKTGGRRFTALLQRYGADSVLAAIRRIMDNSEAQARKQVANFPDGIYEAESFTDDDGLTFGKPIPIRVRVIVEGDQMTVDLSEVAPQVAGYYNSGATAGRSSAQVAFKCLTSPTLFPINQGSFRPLKIILPPGRVISAQKPAATRWWMVVPMTIVDTIFRALAPAAPDRVIAGHHADILVPLMYGTDPRIGGFYMDATVGLPGGGWGATYRHDGANATICINDGDTHNTPIEASEVRSPCITEYRRLRENSGGAGRYRGGLGVELCRRVLGPSFVNSPIDRTILAPWGLCGGKDGFPNKVEVRRADGRVEEFPNGKLDSLPLQPGDALILKSGGGGGFGNPLERPVEEVRLDVMRGYVSTALATSDYGVVLDPVTFDVDHEATTRRRAANSGHD